MLQKGEAMNQLRDLFPDQKEHMKRLAKPDTTVASVMKQLGYNDSVLLLSAWLCVILTDVNLRKYSPAQIIKRKEELVRVLMEEWETSGYALHPERCILKHSWQKSSRINWYRWSLWHGDGWASRTQPEFCSVLLLESRNINKLIATKQVAIKFCNAPACMQP